MAVNDIWEIVVKGECFTSIPLVNRFAYQQTIGSSIVPASFLTGQWIAAVLASLVAVCNPTTVYNSVEAIQLTGGTDFFVQALTTGNVGTRTGSAEPPNVCWSYRYNRSTTTSRNGQKRIGAITTSDTDNGVRAAGIVAATNTLATAFTSPLSDGTQTFVPRILRTRINGAPVVPPEVFSISGVQYVSIGTQNSRKFNKH